MKPRCPRCRVGGYTQKPAPADGRPMFTCTRCEYVWTNGRDGGIYRLPDGTDRKAKPSKKQRRTKQCGLKKRYTTHFEATVAAAEMVAKRLAFASDLASYRCPQCKLIHLGHRRA